MKDFDVVRLTDESELRPGGQLRRYKRAEVLILGKGPFVYELDATDNWKTQLDAFIQKDLQNVRALTM